MCQQHTQCHSSHHQAHQGSGGWNCENWKLKWVHRKLKVHWSPLNKKRKAVCFFFSLDKKSVQRRAVEFYSALFGGNTRRLVARWRSSAAGCLRCLRTPTPASTVCWPCRSCMQPCIPCRTKRLLALMGWVANSTRPTGTSWPPICWTSSMRACPQGLGLQESCHCSPAQEGQSAGHKKQAPGVSPAPTTSCFQRLWLRAGWEELLGRSNGTRPTACPARPWQTMSAWFGTIRGSPLHQSSLGPEPACPRSVDSQAGGPASTVEDPVQTST